MAEHIPNRMKVRGLSYPRPTLPDDFEFETPVTLGYEVNLWGGVKFGAHSYMNGGSVRAMTTIGRFCSLAYGLTIGMGNHEVNHLSTHPFTATATIDRDHKNPFKSSVPGTWKTNIGNDVWVGQNVTILQGVTIGDGAVIAAHSVVRQDVEPYAIIGGVPGKMIRKRFDDETIAGLLETKWWEMPIEFLRTLPVNNIGECIKRVRETDVPRVPISYIRADEADPQ